MEASALAHPAGLSRVSLAGPLLRLRTDDQLVALFRAGHDEAFGTIHDRYRQRLFAYARQMLGGARSDAEDVMQDVFLRAYHALRADRRPVALRAWLYRVAHNRCIDQMRRPTPAPKDIYDLNRGVSTDLLAEAERREDLRRLIADVRALPDQQRSALLMREMEGLSYNELAAALGVTVPAIKSLLVRARVALVESVEARDTACGEIRTDLASAFDRGVRASGRSRKHLRECAGCREYRTALRTVEKRLNGLSPSAGPLTTLAKILGLGGAGSGAAAGGGAMAVGGGGGAAAAGGGAAVSTGVVAATATKVVCVVAAAAVVGGGAATVEQAQHHHQRAAHPAATAAPVARAHITRPAQPRRLDLVAHRAGTPASAAAAAQSSQDGALRPAQVRATTAPPVSSPGTDAPKVEETTGGVRAPDDTAPTGADATATGPGGSGATAGTGTASGTGAASTAAGGTQTPGGTAGGTSTSSADTAAGGGSGTPAAPTGTVSPTSSSAPIAQGAAASPAPAG